jgi:peptidyl-prolyl cis-trans isomerase C
MSAAVNMRTPHSLRHFRLLLVLPVLALTVVLAGCGNADSGASEGDGIPYNVGEALSDSTIALVVSSEYGTDTLATREYQLQSRMRIQRLSPEQRGQDTVQAIHRNLVRQFTANHMVNGTARARDISVDSTLIENQLARIKRQRGEDAIQKKLSQEGMTLDSLRNRIAERLQPQILQRQMAQQAEEPSPSEVEEYSKENARIRVQHILVRVPENASQSKVDSARQAATALLDSIEAGADFSALARRQSDGPSRTEGGDLGFFTEDELKRRMVDSFAEAASALSDSGEVAPDPVRTRYGFHLIQLAHPGKPMDTTEARRRMMQERKRKAYTRELDKLLQNATVRVNPDIVEAGLYE